jgi:hypothetical protein
MEIFSLFLLLMFVNAQTNAAQAGILWSDAQDLQFSGIKIAKNLTIRATGNRLKGVFKCMQ